MTDTFTDTEVQPSSDPSSEVLLLELRNEVREQGASMRRTQSAFSIFALIALLLSGATLLAVAFKLNAKTTTTRTVTAPAVAASTPSTVAAPSTAAAPTTAAATAPALAHTVGVSLREYSVNPTAKAAAAGKVTFRVRNAGSITHEFVVLRTSKAADALLKGARADESGNVGETGDLKAGASKTLKLNLKPGHYALICNLPGHYAAGQHTDFTVR
jgi:uncharacterized cupredoxin-like copper-binding protein